MKSHPYLYFIILFFTYTVNAQTRHAGLPGNTVESYIIDGDTYTDPVDDTINYKKASGRLYTGPGNKTYISTACAEASREGVFKFYVWEYYKDVSAFIDPKSYKEIGDYYFINKEKVYYWHSNADGEYAIEVKEADAKTFVPFKEVSGGKDRHHVFYGGPPDDMEIIKGANPKTIKILNPERGCANCGNCYFIDSKNVFFGLKKIEGADPKTFRLLNLEDADAEDKHGRYFDGIRIK